MGKSAKVWATASIVVRSEGKRVPAGKAFEIDPDELKDMPFAQEVDAPKTKEAVDNSSVDAWDDRAPAIKVAVGLAMDADPARETQPTVKSVEAHLEFKDVKAAEITTAYDELLEERTAPTPNAGDGGTGEGGAGDNDNGGAANNGGTAPQE